MAKRLFNERDQFFDNDGNPLSGGLLFFYVAQSVGTRQNTYSDSASLIPNTNPIVLDAFGRPSVEIWLTAGAAYKVILAMSGDGGPVVDPVSPFWTEDNITGINDVSSTISEWTAGPVATYGSPTTFTLVGDQTSTFTPGRAVKIVDAGGIKYGWIKTSVFTTFTTVTLDQSSQALATPISSVSYGFLDAAHSSVPLYADTVPIRAGSVDESKQWRVELDQNTTGVVRATTIPDYDHRMMTQTHGADIASATTTVLDTATGDLVDVTGTTPITGITLAEGRQATVRFTGILTLTNGASLLLPGAANITTAAGDIAVFRGYALGVVRVVSYTYIGSPPATQGSSMVLLATATAAVSATIDFASVITATYDEYELHINSLLPATNAQDVWLRISEDNGSSFKAGATDYSWNFYKITDAAVGSAVGSTGDVKIVLQSDLPNGTARQNIVVKITRPSSAAANKTMSWTGGSQGSAGGSITQVGSGYYKSDNNAWNAIRILMSSGNITSGNFLLYGIKKS